MIDKKWLILKISHFLCNPKSNFLFLDINKLPWIFFLNY